MSNNPPNADTIEKLFKDYYALRLPHRTDISIRAQQAMTLRDGPHIAVRIKTISTEYTVKIADHIIKGPLGVLIGVVRKELRASLYEVIPDYKTFEEQEQMEIHPIRI